MRRFALCALALLGAMSWIFLAGGETSQGAEPRDSAPQQLSVSDVIKQNLSSWRFKPGKEVFVNKTSEIAWSVDLDAAPDGRLYLAWTEGSAEGTVVKVATSPDGEQWQTEAEFVRVDPYLASVAIAANYGVRLQGAGLETAAVAWIEKSGCFAALRSAAGEWASPQPVWEISPAHGSVAMTSDASGFFHLLALARLGELRTRPLLSTWQRGQGWGRVREGKENVAQPAQVGYRRTAGGLITLSNDDSLITGWQWEHDPRTRSVSDLPWQAWQTQSLWLPFEGIATAIIKTFSPVLEAFSLATSADLQEWSEPAFLGLRSDLGMGSAAAVVADSGLYLVTTYEPWWRERRGTQLQTGETVEWNSPRVFLVDDSVTRDTDGDGLTDITEEWLLTDYQNADTDGDGTADGQDLDPLASAGPEGEEAQIREAVFTAVVPGHRDLAHEKTMVVVAPQRQAFPDHRIRVLCLTAGETEAYQAKYGLYSVSDLHVRDVQVQGEIAVAKWRLGGSTCGTGRSGSVRLKKLEGKWAVVDRGWE